MKIGFFTDDYHPRIDGVVSYVDSMKQALESLGHEVYIICPKYPGHSISEGRIIRVDSYDPLPFSELTSRVIVTNNKMLDEIEKLNLDVIHSHTQLGSNFIAYKLAKRMDKNLFTTMHTTYHMLIDVYPGVTLTSVLMGNFLAWRYYHDLEALKSLFTFPFPLKKKIAFWMTRYIKSVLDYSDLVLTNSKHTERYVKNFGSATEIRIVRNGVDLDFFKSNLKASSRKESKVFHFVLTGRVSGEKRQGVAIRAMSSLIVEGYNCRLTIVGGGVGEKKCQNLIDDLGLSHNVTITGEVSLDGVRMVLNEADVGLFASYKSDTDPLAVKEYLAMGLPVIYCDSNFDDMFLPGSAIKCDKDAKSFALAMKELMKHAHQLQAMRKQAKKSSKKHDIIDRAKELESIYMEFIKSD